MPYGSERLDTATICDDTNNGFGLLYNYNRLGDGTDHTVTLYIDGVETTTRRFAVQTLGSAFLPQVNGVGRVALSGGQSVIVQWSEAKQGFTIVDYELYPSIQRLGSLVGTLGIHWPPSGSHLCVRVLLCRDGE